MTADDADCTSSAGAADSAFADQEPGWLKVTYLYLTFMQDLSEVCLLLLLVQVEVADVLQGLVCHASHSVHPHLSDQHTLPHHQHIRPCMPCQQRLSIMQLSILLDVYRRGCKSLPVSTICSMGS